MTENANTSNMIELYDAYGRKIQITREDYRTNALPNMLKQNWNDPDKLYGVIVSALRDDFIADVLDAARQLFHIDTNSPRGAVTLAAILLKLNTVDQAEKVLLSAKNTHGDNGVLLTNLAKVYSKQGREALSRKTLWRALEIDPNQLNGFVWYTAIAREKGGDVAHHEALERIAELPNSWRAHTWLAQNELAEKNLAAARQRYEKVLAFSKPLPDEALMQITNDLGKAGYLNEIIEMVAPHFNVSHHSISTANNILKAYADTNKFAEARLLIEKLYNQKRPDWRDILQSWESEIEKHSPRPVQNLPKLQVQFFSIDKTLWAKCNIFKKYLPEKKANAIKISFVCGSAQYPLTKTDQPPSPTGVRVIAKKTNYVGTFSRGLPLFLAEQIYLQTDAVGICVVPMFESAPVLWDNEWMNDYFGAADKTESDYTVFLHIAALSEPWKARLTLMNCRSKSLIKSCEYSLDPKDCTSIIQIILRDLMEQLKKTSALSIVTNGSFSPPSQSWLQFYVDMLDMARGIFNSIEMPNADSSLFSERAILDDLLKLCLAQPANIPSRLLLLSTMLKENERRPNIVQEFRQKLEQLQKDKPLQGEIGEAIKQAHADLTVTVH